MADTINDIATTSQALESVYRAALAHYGTWRDAPEAVGPRRRERMAAAALQRVADLLTNHAETIDEIGTREPPRAYQPPADPADHPWRLDTGETLHQPPSQALDAVLRLATEYLVRPRERLDPARRERLRAVIRRIERFNEDQGPVIDRDISSVTVVV